MELGRHEEAEAIFGRLSQDQENPSRAFDTWNLGLAEEAGKRIGPAIKTYQTFEASFPDSNLIEQVRSRLAVLGRGASAP